MSPAYTSALAAEASTDLVSRAVRTVKNFQELTTLVKNKTVHVGEHVQLTGNWSIGAFILKDPVGTIEETSLCCCLGDHTISWHWNGLLPGRAKNWTERLDRFQGPEFTRNLMLCLCTPAAALVCCVGCCCVFIHREKIENGMKVAMNSILGRNGQIVNDQPERVAQHELMQYPAAGTTAADRSQAVHMQHIPDAANAPIPPAHIGRGGTPHHQEHS